MGNEDSNKGNSEDNSSEDEDNECGVMKQCRIEAEGITKDEERLTLSIYVMMTSTA